jgi:hypothetical protein
MPALPPAPVIQPKAIEAPKAIRIEIPYTNNQSRLTQVDELAKSSLTSLNRLFRRFTSLAATLTLFGDTADKIGERNT